MDDPLLATYQLPKVDISTYDSNVGVAGQC